VPETDSGIQGQVVVAEYDRLQRRLRDRGWLETKSLLAHGIDRGHVLEIGPGPGYLGLEWLTSTELTSLTGLDISPDMVALASRNSSEFGLADRATYQLGTGQFLPFEDATFDAVFSAGSLHEWEEPAAVLAQISRVLRVGGIALVLDMRRDMPTLLQWFMSANATSPVMRSGLKNSIAAAYTSEELWKLVAGAALDWSVESTLSGVALCAKKA
jgi:ubiquinone/menaquinone biosynthesis C-methylase UbiE